MCSVALVGPDTAVRLVTAIMGTVELESGWGPVVTQPPVIS